MAGTATDGRPSGTEALRFHEVIHARKFHLEKTSRLERSQNLSSVPVICCLIALHTT